MVSCFFGSLEWGCHERESEGFWFPLVCTTEKSYPCNRKFHRSMRAGGLDLGFPKISWTGLQSVYRVKCPP